MHQVLVIAIDNLWIEGRTQYGRLLQVAVMQLLQKHPAVADRIGAQT